MPPPALTVSPHPSSVDELTTREAVVQGLRAVGLLCWLLVVATALVPTFHGPLPSQLRPGLALLVASYLLTLLGLLLDVRRHALVRVPGFLLLGAALTLMPYRHLFDPPNQWAPGYWALPWLFWAMMRLPRGGYLRPAFVIGPALTLLDLGIRLTNGQPVTRFALTPAVWIAPPMMALVLFGDGLLWLGQRSDELAHRRREAQRQQEDEALARDAHHESDRLMHDHVLHALHALAQGAGQVSPELMVGECKAALRAIGDAPEGGAMLNIGRLLSVDPAMARAGAHLFGTSGIVPRHVALAIAAATHEALDNVARHARATRCDVRVGKADGQWQVQVIDDGVGFDQSRIPADRMGVRSSIVGRMDEIGGSSTVLSRPGGGTRITLSWPRAEDQARPEQLADTQDPVRRRLLRAALPGLATGILMTAIMAPTLQRPLVAAWATLGALGIGLLMTYRLRNHRLTGARATLLLVAAAGGWLVNVWLAPDALPSADTLWMAWGCSALLFLVVLQIPVRLGALVTAGWLFTQVVSLLWRFGRSADWAMLSPTVLTGSGQVSIVLVGLAAARRLAANQVAQQTLTEQARRETARLQLISHLDRFWSRQATDEALPLLEDVAEGRACPHDPAVVERARQLTIGLRDELLLGPDETDLLAALKTARDAGWTINSSLAKEEGQSLQHVAGLVRALGAPAHPQQEVTLSAKGRQAFAVVLTPTPQQQEHWAATITEAGLCVDNDPAFSRLRSDAPAR